MYDTHDEALRSKIGACLAYNKVDVVVYCWRRYLRVQSSFLSWKSVVSGVREFKMFAYITLSLSEHISCATQ